MKKIILSLVLVGMVGFMGCEKDLIPTPNPTVNLLVDEEPNAVVDSMGTLIFDNPMTSDITPVTDATIMDYPLFLDYDPFTMVTSRTGKIDSCVKGIEVTKKEKELLKLFIENEGKVISRDELLDRVWGKDQFPTSRTVDNYILALRKIFEPNPKEPIYFHSIRSVGYKFTNLSK